MPSGPEVDPIDQFWKIKIVIKRPFSKNREFLTSAGYTNVVILSFEKPFLATQVKTPMSDQVKSWICNSPSGRTCKKQSISEECEKVPVVFIEPVGFDVSLRSTRSTHEAVSQPNANRTAQPAQNCTPLHQQPCDSNGAALEPLICVITRYFR